MQPASQTRLDSRTLQVYSPLDWSQALLLLMAVGTLVGGSLWAAADEAAARACQRKAPLDASETAADASEPLAPAPPRQVGTLFVVLFLCSRQACACRVTQEQAKSLVANQHEAVAVVCTTQSRGGLCAEIMQLVPFGPNLLSLHVLLEQDSISPRLRRSTSEGGGSSGSGSISAPEAAKRSSGADGRSSGDVMYVTPKGAVAYLFVASGVLVALFFLLDYINTLIVSAWLFVPP